jgi:DNA-binding response OmpR family regulator
MLNSASFSLGFNAARQQYPMTSILIIEDDPEAAHILELSLKREGYKVSIAMDGMQGLSAIQTRRPDLVLLDLMMPDIDGFEVCRRVRSNPATVNLPIIVVSARTHDADKQMANQVGANGYLTKPYRRTELLALIQARLRK